MKCGVPQGSLLGPRLFLLYMFLLGKIIKPFNNVSYYLFADDVFHVLFIVKHFVTHVCESAKVN